MGEYTLESAVERIQVLEGQVLALSAALQEERAKLMRHVGKHRETPPGEFRRV